VAGSIVAFTAYVWLIHHESPTKVGTYAYVNPVVAILLGYFFGGETIGLRTIVGSVLVLLSLIGITTSPSEAASRSTLVTKAGQPQADLDLRTEN
jgi:drug/metabolite transporter (DMT)-like permease